MTKKIKESVSEIIFELWFQDLKVLRFTDKVMLFSVESEIQLIRINDKYMEQMRSWIKECFDCDVELKFYSNQYNHITKEEMDNDEQELLKQLRNKNIAVDSENKSKSEDNISKNIILNRVENSSGSDIEETDDFNEIIVQKGTANLNTADRRDIIYDNRQNFRLDYTFDNFVVGNSNRFTFTACTVVAKNPATKYNPLFIHGPSGLGKTHLLYAITNEYAKSNGNARIIYVKGEEFTNQLIDSIAIAEKSASMYFREKYRNADILLVDDIQFIAGKDSTQEEFFHTFNSLYESNKQIVLTSDRPPRDIRTLEERLTSRFESGLITDVQPPDLELRIAILKRKAEDMDIKVSNDVLLFLAENITSNIRQIEGAIKKLNAYSYLNDSVITVDLARTSIANILSGTEPLNVTVEKVINLVAQRYNVSTSEIKGRKRTRDIALARHVAIFVIRKITDISLPAIGKIFGRDHSTVMSAVDSMTAEYNKNIAFKIEVDELVKVAKA